MFGRDHDLFFFFFSLIIGFAVFALTQSTLFSSSIVFALLITSSFGAGPFHQGPTWFMYFDKKNRAYYLSSLKKRIIFFAAPTMLLLLSVFGMFVCKPVVTGIWLIWSIQHLVQQNVGILLLYHNHGGHEAIVARQKEVLSLQVPAALFTLCFVRRVLMTGHSSIIFDTLVGVFAVWSLLITVNYFIDLRKQVQDGKSLNVPAFAFWSFSVLCLMPMGFIGRDFTEAFLIPVTWHWFQYIGLNWRLLRKKYGGNENELANLPIAKPVFLFFMTCFCLVVINIFLAICSRSPTISDQWKDLFIGLLIGFATIHYFLDAFIWRFREPYQREAILPYLRSRPKLAKGELEEPLPEASLNRQHSLTD
jgi:hypothetical protein